MMYGFVIRLNLSLVLITGLYRAVLHIFSGVRWIHLGVDTLWSSTDESIFLHYVSDLTFNPPVCGVFTAPEKAGGSRRLLYGRLGGPCISLDRSFSPTSCSLGEIEFIERDFPSRRIQFIQSDTGLFSVYGGLLQSEKTEGRFFSAVFFKTQ
jgi:hypothetical protein